MDIMYLGFKRAFDLVSHDELIEKLEYYGVNGNLLNWIEDFLIDRTGCVRVEGVTSHNFWMAVGVPQGPVLASVLFDIYICDLADNLESITSMFADGTKLYNNPLVSYESFSIHLDRIERK